MSLNALGLRIPVGGVPPQLQEDRAWEEVWHNRGDSVRKDAGPLNILNTREKGMREWRLLGLVRVESDRW